MDAAGTNRWIDGVSTARAGAFEPARLLRAGLAFGMLLLALAGCVLLARKMSGALVSPPSTWALGSVGVLLAVAGLGFRRLLVDAVLLPGVRLAAMLLPSVVSVLWLAALSLAETSGWGLLLLFGPVLLAEGWSWGRFARQDVAAVVDSGLATAAVSPLPAPAPTVANLTEEELLERNENTLGHQTRRSDDDAGEVLEGWLRVDFAAGQRHAAAHIAICPPLERNPTCYAEPVDGPDAGVKVTQAMSYGVRLEVKLAEPAEEPASVIVEYSILEHAAEGD